MKKGNKILTIEIIYLILLVLWMILWLISEYYFEDYNEIEELKIPLDILKIFAILIYK
ncbi:MAG: hypothetical protein QXT38_03995 [Candidatus Aenigmatarchaeota archaeon]